MADLESAHKNLIECGDVENVGTGKAVIASLCVHARTLGTGSSGSRIYSSPPTLQYTSTTDFCELARSLAAVFESQNVQEIASKMKKCSEILQDLAKDMDNVSKRITVVQEQSLVTKTATSPEEAMSQDK